MFITPLLAIVRAPKISPPAQLRVPAMATGGMAFGEPLPILIVSLLAGTPEGSQFAASYQLSFTEPAHVLVSAACAVEHAMRARTATRRQSGIFINVPDISVFIVFSVQFVSRRKPFPPVHSFQKRIVGSVTGFWNFH